MIYEIKYKGQGVVSEELVEIYFTEKGGIPYLFWHRANNWLQDQIKNGNLIVIHSNNGNLKDFEKYKKEKLSQMRSDANNKAISVFAQNHPGKKNKNVRKKYIGSDQFKEDVGKIYEEIYRGSTEEKMIAGYEKDVIRPQMLKELTKPVKEAIKFFNDDHIDEALKCLKGNRTLEDCMEKIFSDYRESLFDLLSSKELCICHDEFSSNRLNIFIDEDYYGNYFNRWNGYTDNEAEPDEEPVSEENIDQFIRILCDIGGYEMDTSDFKIDTTGGFDETESLSDEKIVFSKEDIREVSEDRKWKIHNEKIAAYVYNPDYMWDDAVDALASGLEEALNIDQSDIRRAIEKNPYYQKETKRYRAAKARREYLQSNILTQIPRSYPELYPMARKKFRKFILHIGPTNSGKTHESIERLKEVGSGIYLAPLRLLAYEQYERLNESGYPCSLITGEEAFIQPGANIQASTIEMVSVTEPYQIAVIDEAQMIADPSRGGAWTKAILGLNCREIHVCMSPSAEKIITNLITECGDEYEIIRHERQVPLIVDKKYFSFPEDVEKNDALIVFSKKNVHAVANELKEKGIKASIIYGNLPYDVRQNEARKFQNGETEVVVATDAIGMGLNLPIRRVVFLEDSKFDGIETRNLTPEEFQQIAGRAGRMGMFEEGHCIDASYSGVMKTSMKRSVPEITTAIIGFPEQLIGVNARLSEIIEQWDHIPVINGYKHSDSSELLSRAKELEKYTANKQMIYNFITIPFSENSSVKDLWKKCFLAERDKKPYTFKKMCKEFSISPLYDTISELEEIHKYCDIAYAYAYKFGHTKEIPSILDMKKQISEKIMELLKRQKLEPRKCKYCGKMLPWNYSYGMCSECHDEMYPRRNNRNYYNDWDGDDWEDNEWDDDDDLW